APRVSHHAANGTGATPGLDGVVPAPTSARPGLVDRNGSGRHPDETVHPRKTRQRSGEPARPIPMVYERGVRIGAEAGGIGSAAPAAGSLSIGTVALAQGAAGTRTGTRGAVSAGRHSGRGCRGHCAGTVP